MKFVAVTACPTGIAHSQMAAENLEQTAERLGHDMKVEVQGAMGAENELSAPDIAAADAVIIAADTSVSRDRFTDRPLVKGTVKDAVNDPDALIEEALELVDADDAGDTDGDTAATAASGDSTANTTPDAEQRKRGGDREKSLLNRLKRLFS